MRPSLAGARRLIMRSKVDLPAPERPITPMNAPGATEKEALSTAALVPKRHVKPSTTSMQCSKRLAVPIASVRILQLCDIALRCGNRPQQRSLSCARHDIVIEPIED